MVLLQPVRSLIVVGLVAVCLAIPPTPDPPTFQQCMADRGFHDVTVYADGSVDIARFTWADNNAGQAWDAHTDAAYDACEHLL